MYDSVEQYKLTMGVPIQRVLDEVEAELAAFNKGRCILPASFSFSI